MYQVLGRVQSVHFRFQAGTALIPRAAGQVATGSDRVHLMSVRRRSSGRRALSRAEAGDGSSGRPDGEGSERSAQRRNKNVQAKAGAGARCAGALGKAMLLTAVLLTTLALTETLHQIELRVMLPKSASAGARVGAGAGTTKSPPQRRKLSSAERAKLAAAEKMLAEADAAELAALHETSPIKGLHAKSLQLYERVLSASTGAGPSNPSMSVYRAARMGAFQASANVANELLEDGDAMGALDAFKKATSHFDSKSFGHAGQLEQVRVLGMIVKASRDVKASEEELEQRMGAARSAIKRTLQQTYQHDANHHDKVQSMLEPGALEKIRPFTSRHDDL